MLPNVPPRAEKRRPVLQRHGSTREAFDHEVEERGTERVRARLDSQGSTRGAFFQSPEKGKKKKRSPKKSASDENLSSNALTTGNVGSLALEGLGGNDMGGHFRDSGKKLLHFGEQEKLKADNHRHPRSRHDIEAPQLETIMDSERSIDNTNASERSSFSDRSTDAHTGITTSPLLPRRTESPTYADHYFDLNSKDSWLADLHGSDIPLLNEMDIIRRGSTSPLEITGRSLRGSNIELETSGQGYPRALAQSQQQDIAQFSSMVQAGYGTTHVGPSPLPEHDDEDDDDDDDDVLSLSFYEEEVPIPLMERIMHFFDPTDWLLSDVQYDDGEAILEEGLRWTLPGIVRHVLYHPEFPEFTSLQQFSWAVILGIVMGIYTAVWKNIIEQCVDFVWQTIPGALIKWGLFTDLDGRFPLPHYMWICPSIFGGVLSYIFVILPRKIPGQNEWIQSLHSRGVQEHETFLPLFVLSTLAMSSGMSLGPELPLVLTGGMVGSWLGVICRQSMLQARVMNLTAASAAIAGFFGFPMAGAMFVLEVPHRMGLQYFEALSPATISSILAVLVNRMIVKNDVTGYYNYPFLSATLPSHVFTTAIIYGLLGSCLGITYAESVMYLKKFVHNLFKPHSHHHHGKKEEDDHHYNDGEETERSNGRVGIGYGGETIPLVVHYDAKFKAQSSEDIFERFGSFSRNAFSFGIRHEPTRAAVAGTLAGLVVGITCMFVPIVTFWGEAQLQSLIDKGRTPLPVFGEEDEATRHLIAYGYCLIDPKDPEAVAAGFSIGCAALIASAKIFVTGISLGTGIIAGQFWGPLFVGCAGSHLLTDLAIFMQRQLGFGASLATYPCVSILCMMGACHVVTFRAHMAIMLILTLTISAFDQGNSTGSYTAGDYSAVFPLLVVSVFVSLMLSRGTVFYSTQRSRGDIMALPAVLCEPGKTGAPMIVEHLADGSSVDDSEIFSMSRAGDESTTSLEERRQRTINLNQEDIEKEFVHLQKASLSRSDSESSEKILKSKSSEQTPESNSQKKQRPLPPPEQIITDGRSKSLVVEHTDHPAIEQLWRSARDFDLPSKRLEELLSKPLEPRFRPRGAGQHRRVHSAPMEGEASAPDLSPPKYPRSDRRSDYMRTGSIGGEPNRKRSNSASSSRATTPTNERLVRVTSFGEFPDLQPSLMDQARARASSMHKRTPSLPRSGRHSRQNSNASASSSSAFVGHGDASVDDVERRPSWSRHSGHSSNASVSNASASSSSAFFAAYGDASGALSSDEMERTFSAAINQQGLNQHTPTSSLRKSIWSSGSGSLT